MTAGRIRVVTVGPAGGESERVAEALGGDGDIAVVARAHDAAAAMEEVRRHRPDVVTMDLAMAPDQSRAAIHRIMREVPTPILVLSASRGSGASPEAVEALAAGAVEAIPRPDAWTAEASADLRRMVRLVHRVPVIGRRGRRVAERNGGPAEAPPPVAGGVEVVIGIAASTGGPAAVAGVLAGLAGCEAPVLVVQHIHPSFAEGFAGWLAGASGREVVLARDGERLRPGGAYVAPGDRHLRLARRRTLALDSEPETLHRPSADILFESLAQEAGAQAVGVVLTGMGSDGARGLAALHAAGGRVLAQDRESSVVFGMPQAAVRDGVVHRVVALADMAASIRAAVTEARR
jgi:two-component system chemotaxis response regulator CheB